MVLPLKRWKSRSPPGFAAGAREENPFTALPHAAIWRPYRFIAGWSSPVARQAHNLKVAGSNPAPATNPSPTTPAERRTGRPTPHPDEFRWRRGKPPRGDRRGGSRCGWSSASASRRGSGLRLGSEPRSSSKSGGRGSDVPGAPALEGPLPACKSRPPGGHRGGPRALRSATAGGVGARASAPAGRHAPPAARIGEFLRHTGSLA